MIRQAISCDICGTDKKQTNHWFVAYEHGSELRIADWSSPRRLHPRARHLCGQICLHKLVDDFFARTLAASAASPDEDSTRAGPEAKDHAVARTDASLTSRAAHAPLSRYLPKSADLGVDQSESSARLIAPVAQNVVAAAQAPVSQPAFNTKAWRAEAWKREKERAQRSALEAGDKRRRSIA